MEKIIFYILIVIAALIIILKILRTITGKSDPCSGCSYKSDCKKRKNKFKK